MSHGTTLVTTPTSTVLVTQPAAHTAVVVAEQPQHVVVTRGIPGPPGPTGPPGPIGDAGGALLVTNRLSEFAADPAAQADAQTNLGLGVADPLAYYILAKA